MIYTNHIKAKKSSIDQINFLKGELVLFSFVFSISILNKNLIG